MATDPIGPVPAPVERPESSVPGAVPEAADSWPPMLGEIAAWEARAAAARSLGRVADDLLGVLARCAGASRGSLMKVNPRTGRLMVLAARGVHGIDVGQDLTPAPRRISDWVLRERQGVILNGQVKGEHFEGSAPRDQITSAMSIPLPGPRGAVGVLNLARTVPSAIFDARDLARLVELAPRLVALFDTIEETEIASASWRSTARQIRDGSTPAWGGTRCCRVALARVGSRLFAGDAFEHVSRSDGTVMLMLADVFGTGSEALRIGELTRGLFVGHASYHRSPAKIVGRIHESLLDHDPGSPVSLWVSSHTADGQLVTCNAGYPAALCLSRDGVAERRLGAGGPPAGAAPREFEYAEDRVRQLPGDTLVVVSDGLLSVRDNRGIAYGPERVDDLLHQNRNRDAEEIVHRLCEDALEFGRIGDAVDDLVALAARFTRDESARVPRRGEPLPDHRRPRA